MKYIFPHCPVPDLVTMDIFRFLAWTNLGVVHPSTTTTATVMINQINTDNPLFGEERSEYTKV